MAGRGRIQLLEDLLLDLHFLGDGLDHEIDVAEPLVVGRAADQAHRALEVLLGLLFRDLLLPDEALVAGLR